MALYLGIEGHHTRYSVAALCDEDGRIRAVHRLYKGMSLHTIPRSTLRTVLMDLLQGLVQRHGGLSFEDLREATTCIGLAGTTFPYDAEFDLPGLLREVLGLPPGAGHLLATGDVEIVFTSHAQADRGSAIVCGVGSRATAVTPDGFFHCGGWGPAFADEGSGYALGREVLRELGADHDRGRASGRLWQHVQRHLAEPENPLPEWLEASIEWKRLAGAYRSNGFGDDLRPALFAFAHAMTRKQGLWFWRNIVAGLAIPLVAAYAEGEPTAVDILNRAAASLLGQHEAALRRAADGGADPTPGPVVLFGGVFTHNTPFRDLVLRRLRERYGADLPVVLPTDPSAIRPVCGALLFALGSQGDGRLRLPPRAVVDRMRADGKGWLQRRELRND